MACSSFSAPSKHRNSPPTVSSGVTSHGAKALMASASGTRIDLLSSEPLNTAHTTGSSRSTRTPETCWAFRARSSPSTPAVLAPAVLVSTATSSSRLAMSSIRVSRLAKAMCVLQSVSARQTQGSRKPAMYRMPGRGVVPVCGVRRGTMVGLSASRNQFQRMLRGFSRCPLTARTFTCRATSSTS